MSLPPLPKPFIKILYSDGHPSLYTVDQMREYGEACRKQALEESLILVPGGDTCNPQHIADEIRSLIK